MRIFTLACLTLISSVAFAQPDETEFPDFNYADLNGNQHHLYSYLDAGKTVIVDVMATWCPHCSNAAPALEHIWDTHGPSGDDTMVVLSFERDANTTNEVAWAADNNVTSPIITGAEDVILNDWNITYQPRYFVICPDRSWQLHVGMIGDFGEALTDLAEPCAPVVSVEENVLDALSLQTTESELRVNGLRHTATFKVFGLNGQSVAAGALESGRTSVDISDFVAGVYLLRVESGAAHKVLRFVKP